MPVDRTAAARAIAEFLRALGHDSSADPELAATPERVAEAYEELLAGYEVDIGELVRSGSAPDAERGDRGIVVVSDIALVTVCPHHLLPSTGSATVAYRPGARLLGLGTVAALVVAVSRRLALQERIGQDVVGALVTHAGARGAWCRLSLSHGCLATRGARQAHATVQTTSAAGDLAGPEGTAELGLALAAAEKRA
jgi:GTP cyclohydrolase I